MLEIYYVMSIFIGALIGLNWGERLNDYLIFGEGKKEGFRSLFKRYDLAILIFPLGVLPLMFLLIIYGAFILMDLINLDFLNKSLFKSKNRKEDK